MTLLGIAQIVIFFAIVVAITKPVGVFMYRVFEGERTFLHPVFRPLERLIYWLGGVREDEEQSWVRYSASMISLSIFSFLFVYLLQRLQGHLPLNPMHFSTPQAPSNATPMTPDLAFNTAVSFMTNTNWQAYSPDTTMSYLTQMAALAVQNFVSAAVGIAVAVALIRGFARHTAKTIGNFWVDVTRCTLYILLPICILATLFFVWQGSIQNFKGPATATTLEGASQVIEQGPLASQLAIKMLGTNGGGYFNANSAHPYENPTPLANLLQMLLIFSLGAGLTYMFGKMVRDTRQGWAIFAAMAVMFLAGAFICYWAEQRGNPMLTNMGVEQRLYGKPAGRQHGRQRSPVRQSDDGAVCHGDNGRQLRSRDRHARQLHADRRAGSAVQHTDRRSDLRRRRRRSLQHVDLCRRRRLHRRLDGRAHARICGQEDRAKRSQDGHHRDPGDFLGHSWVHRHQFRGAVCEGRLLEFARTGRREYE